jgi:hypothetical protein
VRETYALPEPYDQLWLERLHKEARAAVTEEAFATAWTAGRAMNWDQAVTYALAVDAPC